MTANNEILDTTLYLMRLFKASKQNGVWKSDEKLKEKINAPGFHIANGTLNPKQNTFYYTQCNKQYHCIIKAVAYQNGHWGMPYEIKSINMDEYTSTQPHVAEIGGKEVIFFSSNRPGGSGKLDIWFAQKNNHGIFQKPVNAGNQINSIDDEITPFYHSKDTALYFSSNWHEGLGGFDIFKSKTDLNTFNKPKNLGYPINTSTNDFYYAINNKTTLLTSNRIGSFAKKGETCCNDIYIYEIPDTLETSSYTSLEELQKYLPVKLYFHNDEPDPRTTATLTNQNYFDTYQAYFKLLNTYQKAYAKGLKGNEKEDALFDIADFFEEDVKKGVADLSRFTPLLIAALEKGKIITLTIKGYASPLSKSDYNVKLTLRRISSLINYLKEYENGKILPYIHGTAENGAKLNFIKVPFGEYQAVKKCK